MAGVNFSLDSAKRIIAAVKKSEQSSTDLRGDNSPTRQVGRSFFAMVTGAGDIKGIFHDWVAVQPSKAMATGADSNTLATSAWDYQTPYVAGWGNLREMNDNRAVPPGTVVLITFVGYAIPDGLTSNPGTTTIPASSAAPPTRDDGSIPMYVFQYASQSQSNPLPIHDHRDNLPEHGGYSFAVYAPGTALPQQNWRV